MASIRNIKKDVDFLISEVIGDCWVYMHFNPGKKLDEVEIVLTKATELRNDLYSRINHPENKKDAKAVKGHYRAISKDLLEGVNGLFEQISSLAK